jgi:hypothetical protein
MRNRNVHAGGLIFDLLIKGIFMGLGLIWVFSLAFESVWVQQ